MRRADDLLASHPSAKTPADRTRLYFLRFFSLSLSCLTCLDILASSALLSFGYSTCSGGRLFSRESPLDFSPEAFNLRILLCCLAVYAGLCKTATLKEVEAQGWSLNPGRYVGVAAAEKVSDEDFKTQLEKLNEELEGLNAQARELEQTIAANVAGILRA